MSAVAVAEAAIDAHDSRGGPLAAYKHWHPEGALQAARAVDAALAAGYPAGPLAGMPLAIKDLFGVAGMPICAGTPKELPEEWRREGPVVRALKQAFGVVMGKTHTVEFAFGPVGTNAHWGAPRNPWDANGHRVCGGSSAGAGVSLAEGSAVIAMGTDTGGSVRIPASVTGQVGLKVAVDRWSVDGIVPLSPSFDTPGPLTRSAEDAAVAFAVIDPSCSGVDALFARIGDVEAADLRLAVCDEHFWDDCSPGVAEGVKEAIDELSKTGARVRRIAFPDAGEARERFFRGGFFGVEGITFVDDLFPDRAETFDPDVGIRFAQAREIKATDYFLEMRKVRALAAIAAEKLRHVDALLTPTVPITPPLVGEVADRKGYSRHSVRMTQNTQPVNLLGLCAITLPVALDAVGMPVGLQLVGRAGEEERLLAAALACERVLGMGAKRIGTPPLCRN
ncbi:MAG: amidase [Acetobacterales bacterium]